MKTKLLGTVCTALTTLLFLPFQAGAQTSWNQPGGGNWQTPGNWTNGIPVSGGAVTFTNNAEGIIDFTGNGTTANLTFGNTNAGQLVLDLNGHRLTSTAIRVGNTTTSPNNVTFQDGNVTFQSFVMEGVGNQVVMSGVDFLSTATTRYLRIDGGDNTLTIQDGATVTVTNNNESRVGGSGSTGNNQLIVSGVGSQLSFLNGNRFSVGRSEDGGNLLRIENGGHLLSTLDATNVGYSSHNNRLEIDGEGSTAQISALWIGGDGGSATSGDMGNIVRITNSGLLTTTGVLEVGGNPASAGGNRLEVSSGGLLQANSEVRLGRQQNDVVPNNVIQLTDGGRMIVNTTMRVYKGTLEIDGGSLRANTFTVDNHANTILDFRSGLISANTANVQRPFQVGDGLSEETAVYRMTSGTHAIPSMTLQSNARLEGIGTLAGAVTTTAGAVVAVGWENEGEKTFGVLTINHGSSSNWDNEGVQIVLGIGDLSGETLQAGTHYDQLLFGSNYTFLAGGEIVLDLSHYQAFTSLTEQVKVLGWQNFSGNWENIVVSFSEPVSDLVYAFQADGLYISAIPEPHSLIWVGLLCLGFGFFYRKRRSAS